MSEQFGPKTWGQWSARLAAPYAALMLLNAATTSYAWIFLLALAPLGVGATRTLKKQSGGLRLLSGAWGLVAGLAIAPIAIELTTAASVAALSWILALLAAAGLALTVLHKEK